MNIEDYANMTPEEHAYYEGKAEGNAEIDRLKKESDRLCESARYWQGEALKKTRKVFTYDNAGCETHSEVESTEAVCLVCLVDERDRLRETVIRYDKAESAALADMEKYKEFYHASVAEHRKSIEMIDSLESQIEVLRPVYEAAKILIPAQEYGKRKDVNNATYVLVRAVNLAARELEDSDE